MNPDDALIFDENSKMSLDGRNSFRKKKGRKAAEARAPFVHFYRKGVMCTTNRRGYPTPRNRSPLELVVDTRNGYVPLWGPNVTLHWRFDDDSFETLEKPEKRKDHVREMLARGITLWGDACPVSFTERRDDWDFEIRYSPVDDCDPNGCTHARAFFPDMPRSNLLLYPILFDQSAKEQVETMAHELGHIFGLRHFFALLTETWPAEKFGAHSKFSIMNYDDLGAESRMTENDRSDLKALYKGAWDGSLTEINGTKIRLFRPSSENAGVDDVASVAEPDLAANVGRSGRPCCCCCCRG